MSASAIKAGNAYVEISARDKALRDSLEANKKRMQQFVKTVAVIGAAAVIAGAAAGISAASDMEETLNKFNVVFGENREAMKQWADEFAQQVGRSKRQVAEFLSNTQDLLIPVGLDEAAATNMSKQITQLAVDVASFNNKLDADVLRDFHSALTGGGETVKKYGVVLDVAATKAKLLEAGIDPNNASNAQKVWARWQIILGATTAAQGDAVRSSDAYANQMKRLEGQLEDLAASAGAALLPVVSDLVNLLNTGLTPLVSWVSNNQEMVTTMAAVAGAIAAVVITVKAINAAMAVYAQRAAVAAALSGPAGWATLAVGIAAATFAVQALNDQMAETDQVAEAAASGLEKAAEASRKVYASERELAETSEQIRGLMDQEATTAEKLAAKLDVLRVREEALAKQKRGGRDSVDRDFGESELEQLRTRLIDSATGFGGEMQKVRDEIAKINGELTESQIKLREMAAKGLPAEEMQQLAAAYSDLAAARSAEAEKKAAADARQQQQETAAADRQAELDSLQAGADRIREAVLGPQDEFRNMIEEMRDMIKAGVLDRETANAFVQQQLAQQAMAQREAAASFNSQNSNDLRSSQGATLLARLLNDSQSIEQRMLTTNTNTERNTRKTTEAIEKLNLAGV